MATWLETGLFNKVMGVSAYECRHLCRNAGQLDSLETPFDTPDDSRVEGVLLRDVREKEIEPYAAIYK